jgi:hypothetical protein
MGQSFLRQVLRAVCFALSCQVLQPAGVVAATLVVTQSPCASSSFCSTFTGTGTLSTVRSIVFNAPGTGFAQVLFNGSLFCAASGSGASLVLDGQIVDNVNATATSNGRGGQRYAITLEASGRSDTFGLTATRTFSIPAAGRYAYYFKINRVEMSDAARCWVHNPLFSVIFMSR